MLGFEISERTISRWMKRAPRDPEPGKRWLAFLRNHQEVIAAMDFFTVPTIRFGVLYCFFVIAHDRRRVLHCNVSKHPTSKHCRDTRVKGCFAGVGRPECESQLPLP